MNFEKCITFCSEHLQIANVDFVVVVAVLSIILFAFSVDCARSARRIIDNTMLES